MLRYVIKRLLMMIPVVFGVTFLVFTMLYFTPGDPAVNALGATSTEEQREAWREERGLNDSFLVRFGNYCRDVFLRGDFGKSYSGDRSISQEIATRLPVSAQLALLTILVDFLIGTPVGIISAVKRYTLLDNVLMVLTLVLVSMPAFWIGLELSIIFSLRLGLLPASGLYGPEYYILPVVSLALGGISSAARMTRSCMLDVINADYMVTARAKGVHEGVIIFRHGFRNALIPIITQIGGAAASMIGGALITEIVFSIPGMGTYMVNSIKAKDYPVVLGCVVVLAIFASIILLLTDLCYALVDPRIRAQFSARKKGKVRVAKES